MCKYFSDFPLNLFSRLPGWDSFFQILYFSTRFYFIFAHALQVSLSYGFSIPIMQPRCGSEIKISSLRNFLMQVRSRRQHGQHCYSSVPGECELHRSFAQNKIFTLLVESRPVHFPGHVTDMCESAFRLCVNTFWSHCMLFQVFLYFLTIFLLFSYSSLVFPATFFKILHFLQTFCRIFLAASSDSGVLFAKIRSTRNIILTKLKVKVTPLRVPSDAKFFPEDPTGILLW